MFSPSSSRAIARNILRAIATTPRVGEAWQPIIKAVKDRKLHLTELTSYDLNILQATITTTKKSRSKRVKRAKGPFSIKAIRRSVARKLHPSQPITTCMTLEEHKRREAAQREHHNLTLLGRYYDMMAA